MIKVDISNSDLKKIEKKLKEVGGKKAASAIRKGSRAGAKIIASKTKDLVPVNTGALKRAIKVRALKRSRTRIGAQVQLSGSAFSGRFYGGYVEYGTKKHKGAQFMRKASKQAGGKALEESINVIRGELAN